MKLRWKELLLALIMAVVVWYSLSGTEIVESQVDVRVDYKGIPKDLVVRGEGLVNKVSVRVRGPIGQIRVMSTRDYVFAMDLSSLEKGGNSLPVSIARSGLFGGLQVIDVNPSSIQVEVDSLESKSVPVKENLLGSVPDGYSVETRFVPEAVTIRGPSQELEVIKDIAVPIHLGEAPELGSREHRVPLTLPTGVEADPGQVSAYVSIDLKRKRVNVSRTVRAEVPDSVGAFFRPQRVKISINMPEDKVAGAGENTDIRAFVTLPDRRLGTYTLPVRVMLPDGAQLISIDPEEISVTLEQKN